MNWPLFFSTYVLIFLAELPDKTAFATLLLASRGRGAAVFFGVASAFLVQTIVAVFFGKIIALAPAQWVHLAAGLMFLGFAAHLLLENYDHTEEDAEKAASASNRGFFAVAWAAFLVIFIAEWGDLTQIATASLIAKYSNEVVSVFLGALFALWSVTLVAILVGQHMAKLVKPATLKKISILLFTAIGGYFLWTWFQGA